MAKVSKSPEFLKYYWDDRYQTVPHPNHKWLFSKDNFRTIVDKKKISRRALARAASMPVATVCRIYNGTRPNADQLMALAVALDASPYDFFRKIKLSNKQHHEK
jgi:hypothetical protein